MAYLGAFDANTVEPADFSALPSGDYKVIISDSLFKPSKGGSDYLALTIQVVDGPHSGRYLWHNLNLNHSNPKAVEIAQRELSAICRATGRMTISDSAELHDVAMIAKVVYVPAKDDGNGGQYPEKNQIKQWRKIGETAVATTAPAPQAQARAARSAPPPAPAAAPKTAPPPAPPKANGDGKKPWLGAKAAPVADEAPAKDIPF
jgi:hypothetical protein